MRARRAATAALLLGSLAAPLAACGIEPTEVVEVGQPAQGVRRPGVKTPEVRLYFGFPGGVQMVNRPADAEVSAEEAVPLLLAGPNEAEKMRGLYSELPRIGGRFEVVSAVGRVTVSLPLDVTRLSPVARVQLVCTAAHNTVPGGLRPEQVRVDLAGAGKKIPDLLCDKKYNAPAVAPAMPTSAP
ncbi:hypothetical protein ABZ442_08970 [Streptomyces triculaminicus]|uniref:hypothetical protein n=1 Tax=Streptomyces triculaminicus TaxID=2816232 RepID=UPI0033C381FF